MAAQTGVTGIDPRWPDGAAGPEGRGRREAEEPPLVSIGMPVHNGARHVRRALDTLLAQDYPRFELIISDNASTDATGEICREFAALDGRVRYCATGALLRPTDNFNRLIGLASGRYFMWAAHDDFWEPSYVREMVRALESAPDAVLAFSAFDNRDEDGKHIRDFRESWGDLLGGTKFRQFVAMAVRDESRTQKANHIYGLMRREVLQAAGGMAPLSADYSGEDVVTLLKLLARGRFVVVPQVLFHYMIRAPRGRGDARVAGYVLRRAFARTPGHRGNVFLAVARSHVLHSAVRRVVMREAPLPLWQRCLLALMVTLKEVWMPVKVVPVAVLRELRGGATR